MTSNVPNLYPSPTKGLLDEALAVDATAGGVQLTASGWTPGNCQYVAWQCQTNSMCVTFDGSAPTSSNGFILTANQSGIWTYSTAKAAKFIRVSADGVLFAQPMTT